MNWNLAGAEVALRGGLTLNLLRDIARHLRFRAITPARFGRDVLRDPRFVFDLRNGREPRPATIARVRLVLEAGQ